jgi:hypothetical protein
MGTYGHLVGGQFDSAPQDSVAPGHLIEATSEHHVRTNALMHSWFSPFGFDSCWNGQLQLLFLLGAPYGAIKADDGAKKSRISVK